MLLGTCVVDTVNLTARCSLSSHRARPRPWHFFAKFLVAKRGRGNILKREGAAAATAAQKVCSETRVKWANYRGGKSYDASATR